MYKVFFVDDEASMRQGIRDNINWDDSDFVLSGEAPDGEMALSLIQEILPDILITDVKMPFMNGIELSEKVKRIMPWVKIIIVSGHDEFEFAKRAITIGVEEYLLKPITSENLMNVLNRVAAQISEEQNELKKLENLEALVSNSKTFQIEMFLSDLVYGNIEEKDAFALASKLDFSIKAQQYLLMQIEIHRSVEENYNILQSARSWAIGVLSEWEHVLFFAQGSDRIVCILLTEEKLASTDPTLIEENAFACAHAVKYAVERNVPCLVSVAIGSVVFNMGELSKSLADSDMVKRYLALSNQKQIMSLKDVSGSGFMPLADIDKLPILDKLRYGAKSDVSQLIDNYFQSFHGSFSASFLFMNYVFVDVLMAASKLIEELGGVPDELLSDYSNINSIIKNTSNIEDFKTILTHIFEKVFDFRDSQMGSQYRDVIAKAKAYIQQNFAEQSISLHAVAKVVNVSPNHFSTIFSQETGETFINYITKLRIETAKNLLKTTTMRTADIGYDVGYNDTHYFSYVFKKHVGMTPKEFRK